MKVLVVEDDFQVRETLLSDLSHEGYSAFGLGDGVDLISQIARFSPDFLLMDLRLPGRQGIDLVRDVRSSKDYSHLPIIVISGLCETDNKVNALELGADDYLTKPYRIEELVARMKAVSRRVRARDDSSKGLLAVKDLVVDLNAHRVLCDKEEIELTLTEYKILCELLTQTEKVLSREELCRVALDNLNVTERTIDVHVAALRKKLGEPGKRIETVRGVGYRFTTQI